MSIYTLKPKFQALLRPLVVCLHRAGVTANQVTLTACLLSMLVGVVLSLPNISRVWFLSIPVWMFVRMAMNAIDGMLAREFGQQSFLGAYLNELGDVIADTLLFLPFAFVSPFTPGWIALISLLAILSEFSGVLGAMVGASRRYDGPLGKSDRAFVFGALGLAIALLPELPAWLWWLMPVLAVAIAITIMNRIRAGLHQLTQENKSN